MRALEITVELLHDISKFFLFTFRVNHVSRFQTIGATTVPKMPLIYMAQGTRRRRAERDFIGPSHTHEVPSARCPGALR